MTTHHVSGNSPDGASTLTFTEEQNRVIFELYVCLSQIEAVVLMALLAAAANRYCACYDPSA